MERKVSSLEAFAYDIGANPFRACHVKCLESLSQTTGFTTTAHRVPWLEVQQYGLCIARISIPLFRPLNEIMNNGPLPTTLVFLSDLPSQAHGDKVRFLGCVTRYSISTGVLELQHVSQLSPARTTVALVDVNVILESLKREDMEVGAWVNVVGYVEEVLKDDKRQEGQAQGKAIAMKKNGNCAREGPRAMMVRIHAVMLWSAGAVKIGEYEKVLEERLKPEGGPREGSS